MLPNCCGKWSSQKPRRSIYSSLLRYPRSIFRQTDDHQNSPSIFISDDNQKLTGIVQISNMTEYNGLTEPKKDNKRKLSDSTMNKINNHEYKRSVSRESNSNQFILMTTVNEGNNNMAATYMNECLLNIQKSPRTLTLGKWINFYFIF